MKMIGIVLLANAIVFGIVMFLLAGRGDEVLESCADLEPSKTVKSAIYDHGWSCVYTDGSTGPAYRAPRPNQERT